MGILLNIASSIEETAHLLAEKGKGLLAHPEIKRLNGELREAKRSYEAQMSALQKQQQASESKAEEELAPLKASVRLHKARLKEAEAELETATLRANERWANIAAKQKAATTAYNAEVARIKTELNSVER